MAYVDRVLLRGEVILRRPQFSRFAAYGAPLVEFAGVAIAWTVLRFIVLGVFMEPDAPALPALFWLYIGGMLLMAARFGWRMMVRFLNLMFSELAVTNWRYMEKAGVLDVSFWATDLEKLQRVEIEQPLLGRIFDYGDITIVTLGEIAHTTHAVAAPIRLQQALHARMTHADLDRRPDSPPRALSEERMTT
jgi:hypothetical protein